MALLDILIPTYNRATDLEKNLTWLSNIIQQEANGSDIRIIISDNCSSDQTKNVVESFINKTKCEVTYHRNNENIGLEPNMVKILSLSTSPFVMWIGDDDYIAEGYLSFVLNRIKIDTNLGAVITGIQNLLKDDKIVLGRIETFDTKDLNAGFDSALCYSHLGHQLSGLVMSKEGLLEHYLQFPQWRNPYLFIHLVTWCLLKYPCVYAPMYKTTITTFNQKDWGYNGVGLLDEVFKSYYSFQNELNSKEICELMLRFSVMHSYRFNISPFNPLRIIKQYKYLVKNSPQVEGFASKLFIQLLKEYILSFKHVKG